jgi:hypothetical protein
VDEKETNNTPIINPTKKKFVVAATLKNKIPFQKPVIQTNIIKKNKFEFSAGEIKKSEIKKSKKKQENGEKKSKSTKKTKKDPNKPKGAKSSYLFFGENIRSCKKIIILFFKMI